MSHEKKVRTFNIWIKKIEQHRARFVIWKTSLKIFRAIYLWLASRSKETFEFKAEYISDFFPKVHYISEWTWYFEGKIKNFKYSETKPVWMNIFRETFASSFH